MGIWTPSAPIRDEARMMWRIYLRRRVGDDVQQVTADGETPEIATEKALWVARLAGDPDAALPDVAPPQG